MKQSSHAFAAIANAYASEISVNVKDSGSHSKTKVEEKASSEERLQTQHPIHLAILKKIASKIEKEEKIKNKKGFENYRRVMTRCSSLIARSSVTRIFTDCS